MKKSILAGVLLASSLSFADSFKVMPFASFNMSNTSTEQTKAFGPGDEKESKTSDDLGPGFGVGVGVEVPLVPMLLNLRTGVSFDMYSSSESESEEGYSSETTTSYSEINIPVLAVFQFGPAYAGAGVEYGYVLSAEQEDETSFMGMSETTTVDLLDTELLSSSDLKAQVIVGYEIAGVGPGSINLEGFFNYSLLNRAGDAELMPGYKAADYFNLGSMAFGLRAGMSLGI